jgi:hypothetical protein
MKGKKRRWIQDAVENEGALRRWLKRNWRKVVGATKKPVWTKDGEINTNTLKQFRNTEAYKKLPTETKQRINLGIRLEGYSKRAAEKRKKRSRKAKRKSKRWK